TYKDSREKHSAQHHLSRISATNPAKPAPAPVCPIEASARCALVAPSLVPVDIEAEIVSDSGPDVLIHLFMISPSSFTRDICTAPAPTSPAPISPTSILPELVSHAPISPALISPAPIAPAPASSALVSPAPASPAPIAPAPTSTAPAPASNSLAITLLELTLHPCVSSGPKLLLQDQEYDLILDTLELYCCQDPDSALDDKLLEQRELSLYSNQDSDTVSDYDSSSTDTEYFFTSYCSSPDPFSLTPEASMAWATSTPISSPTPPFALAQTSSLSPTPMAYTPGFLEEIDRRFEGIYASVRRIAGDDSDAPASDFAEDTSEAGADSEYEIEKRIQSIEACLDRINAAADEEIRTDFGCRDFGKRPPMINSDLKSIAEEEPKHCPFLHAWEI
ncbi:hypothetical protein BG004_002669, partial [Podila humilis]